MVARVRVGSVLALQRRAAEVRFDGTYEEIGIRSFGRGVFHKEPVQGASLGAKRVFRIEPGDLLLSNVFAWEGAIAVASEAERGKIGSHRFMTYTPMDSRIDNSWAAWFFRSEPGLELIRMASPGSAGRNRTLAIDRFEALEIPLPSIDEQRRVTARLDRVATSSDRMSKQLDRARALSAALADSRESQVLSRLAADGIPVRPLGEIVEINPRPDRLSGDQLVAFVPMAAVSAEQGEIESVETRSVGEVGNGYKQFRRGDVIFARITPCMQNGKAAILREYDYALGSTEFHVLRPGPEVTADWVHRVVRSRQFRLRAAERFTGTAGQQRVPASFLAESLVPLPVVGDQTVLIVELDSLRSHEREAENGHDRFDQLVRALIPSALNEAFGTSLKQRPPSRNRSR